MFSLVKARSKDVKWCVYSQPIKFKKKKTTRNIGILNKQKYETFIMCQTLHRFFSASLAHNAMPLMCDFRCAGPSLRES